MIFKNANIKAPLLTFTFSVDKDWAETERDFSPANIAS